MDQIVGVTVSIGLAPNRLLAKIAAGRDKPRGFAVIGVREAAALVACEPVRLLPGIGAVQARKTCVAGHNPARPRPGDEGPSLAARARGEDTRLVDPSREPNRSAPRPPSIRI